MFHMEHKRKKTNKLNKNGGQRKLNNKRHDESNEYEDKRRGKPPSLERTWRSLFRSDGRIRI